MEYTTHAPYFTEGRRGDPHGHFIVIGIATEEYYRVWGNEEKFNYTEVYKWCSENFHEVRTVEINGKKEEYEVLTWDAIQYNESWIWRFESKEDAMAFKLRWE